MTGGSIVIGSKLHPMDLRLERDIAGMFDAQQTLMARIADLTDEEVLLPSRLPDWTVGHVLTHIARNGDSFAWRLEGSARGEVVDQYPGGADRRAADIEAGARTSAELFADLVTVHERLDVAVGCMQGDAWDAVTRDLGGTLRPARDLPVRRWREVEVHHVDLGLGYEITDWPDEFVERSCPQRSPVSGPASPESPTSTPRPGWPGCSAGSRRPGCPNCCRSDSDPSGAGKLRP